MVGRATLFFKDIQVPVEDLAHQVAENFFRQNFHALDPEKHVKINTLVRPGAPELVELFLKYQKKGVPLANDTSIGVGFAPMSPLEELVLKSEKYLNAHLKEKYPAIGEDIKVMGVREEDNFRLTIACAAVGRYLSGLNDYFGWKEEIVKLIKDYFSPHYPNLEVFINAADDPDKGDIYLTVTGTSAEAGDDGEVGRGNRVNGLITPFRPMSLEAAAGKNPISHVGKIYNLLAQKIAQKLVSEIEEIEEAYVTIVSRIGYHRTPNSFFAIKNRRRFSKDSIVSKRTGSRGAKESSNLMARNYR